MTKLSKRTLWNTVAVEHSIKGDIERIRKPVDWDYCPLCNKLAARSGIRNHYRVKHPNHFVAVELHILELRGRNSNGRN